MTKKKRKYDTLRYLSKLKKTSSWPSRKHKSMPSGAMNMFSIWNKWSLQLSSFPKALINNRWTANIFITSLLRSVKAPTWQKASTQPRWCHPWKKILSTDVKMMSSVDFETAFHLRNPIGQSYIAPLWDSVPECPVLAVSQASQRLPLVSHNTEGKVRTWSKKTCFQAGWVSLFSL